MFRKLQHFGLMIKNAMIKHPLEILFVTYMTAILMQNVGNYEEFRSYENLIALAPICFVLLYLVRSSKAYWLLTPVPIAVALFSNHIGIELMMDSRYWAVAACTFLCLISQYWHKDNRRFVDEMTNKLINLVFAGALATIIFAVLSCITIAITALFDLEHYSYDIFERFGIFTGFWAFPALFLTLEQQHATNDSLYLNRVGEMLLNWILSPSLIIYTAIIYAYVVFITAKGQMPNGIVANVAFPYLTVGLAIQAVQLLLQNAKWQWFYRYFAYLALLPLALVWYAIYIRLSNYGLTESRIYLVIGASTLSICYGLLLFKHFSQYRLFSAISIAVILVSVFVLDPQKIALEDQTQRLDNYLVEHQLLDASHKINIDAVVEYKKSIAKNRDEIEHLDSMLMYVSRESTSEQFKQKYGIEFYDLFSQTGEKFYEENRFKAQSSTHVIRLTQADMKNVREYIMIDWRIYRPTGFENIQTNKNGCQKLIHQIYDLQNLERHVKYETLPQECEQIKRDLTDFKIEFLDRDQTIQFNIHDVVKNIFKKHGLDITKLHDNETLNKLKADLLKLDLGNNAVLSLDYLELNFVENIGYIVEELDTQYLLLK